MFHANVKKAVQFFNLAGTNRERTSRDEEGTGRDEKLILIMNMRNDDDYYDLLT